ncbi:MAG: glycosyltransferase [Eubacterium sp.]|jgi:glycosyltransferase involved in cell wall biosynthesis|nr:glycosyltransferase [Eubacterium sp.]
MGKKLKIMHVLNSGDYSGAESVVITIIENYGKNVQGIYVGLKGEIGKFLEAAKIKYYPVSKLNLKNLKIAVKEIKPDIIHAHDFRASCLTAMLMTESPILSHLHSNPLWIRRICPCSVAYFMLSFRFQKILTVSASVMQEYCFGKQLENKVIITGNPADTAKIRRLADKEPAGMYRKQEFDVAFLGRLVPEKNPHLFLKIIHKLKKMKPDIRAVMIGDGEMRRAIENEICRRDMKETIQMTGFLKNPYPVLKQAKVLCMPSSCEGFGLAAIEALSVGKPVVCSAQGGLKDIVTKKCGLVCQSEKDYTDEIFRLLTSQEYYSQKSFEAEKRSQLFDNIPEYMQKLVQTYSQVLSSTSRDYRTVC